MATFTGQLRTNSIYSSLFNQIISIQTFGTGVEIEDSLYGKRRADGGLFGDTKLYVSTDAGQSYAFSQTGNPGYNLLSQKFLPNPVEERIVIDQFRQIPLSTDTWLSKQAYMDEGSFAQFHGTLLAWLGKTREIYEHTAFTAELVIGARKDSTLLSNITLTSALTGYDKVKWQAQELFRVLEDAVAELKEPSRAYNDNGFIRTARMDDFDIVIPLGVLSNVSKHDVPFLYNPDNKPYIHEVHWKYFGSIITTVTATAAGTERSLLEQDFTVSDTTTHCFPGDLVPAGAATIPANTIYTPKYSSRPTIQDGVEILLIHKDDFPILSAFSVATEFPNPQTLVTNNYLTFGHSRVLNSHIGEFPLLRLELDIELDPGDDI